MIRSLRRRHLATFAVLAVALPAAYLVALGARTPMPRSAALPPETDPAETLSKASSSSAPVAIEPLGLFAMILRHDSAENGRTEELSVGVMRRKIAPREPIPPPIPDPLVYRCESAGVVGEALPEDCRFIGALRDPSRQSFIVTDSTGRGEHLAIYSLGHQEVVGIASWPALGEESD